MVSVGGGPGGGGSNNGRIMVQLVPRAQRDHDGAADRAADPAAAAALPGFRGFVGLPPSLQIGGRMGNQNFSLMMQSLNTDELYAWAPKLRGGDRAQVPEVQDVSTDMEMKSPRINLVIDRDKAAAVGLNATQIAERALRRARAEVVVDDLRRHRAVPRAARARSEVSGRRPTRSRRSRSRRRNGALVPLESVVDFKETVGPQSINHSGQLPSVSISFGLRPGVSLGAATAHVKQVADRLLPATITTSFEGSAKVFQQSMNNLGAAALRRHRRRLHRARRALRELHPPDHDSLGAAVGRARRAGHAVAVRQRAEHLLVRRPDHADRHRQEERDHADRLRARGRAPARQVADRGDLRRLPHPLPPDHDDDDGGAARRRCRSRSATAPAAKRAGRSASPSSAAWWCRS